MSAGLPGQDRIFAELQSRNKDVRNRAAHELFESLVTLLREVTPERFQDYYAHITERLSHLIIRSQNVEDKLGGIAALDLLIDFDGVDAAKKTTQFAGFLRQALRSNDPTVLAAAAKSLGRLARPGGALTAELVEAEIQAALEWLSSDRQESRRLAAVLVIRELARNSPTLLYGFVPQIFELIWVALRDPKPIIRETAAEAVSACFAIIVARDTQIRQQWFSRIYDEALAGLKSSNTDWIHGSLLILSELLSKGSMFMQEYYRSCCEILLRLKDHRDPKIRAQVTQTIPVLADYHAVEFVNNYLHKFMIYLQSSLKREKDRNVAFIAIGKIALAVGSAMAQYLDGIILYIRENLSAKVKNRAAVNEAPMFQCISMMSIAVGQVLSKYMEALLDPIFACGLSEPLVQALVDMAHYIRPIGKVVQEKLLDLLSLILTGAPYRPLGCPDGRAPPLPSFAKDYGAFPTEHSDSQIALALHTLGSFDFQGHFLNEFVRDVTARYVDNKNPEIRKAAALTCCQLFMQDPIVYQTSAHSIQVVREVIDKLLTIGVGDEDADIRCKILQSLDSKFDRHLGRPENIRCLFLAVNDEVFAVREAAICIIGRLSATNPAYVFPPLRKLLVNLLTGLGYANTARQKEECAKLISLFVRNGTKLIRTYVDPMVSALLPKATDPNSGVSATIIRALGEMATVGGEEIKAHIPKLMPILLDALQDLGSPAKREAALKTISQLALNSGYVVKPYKDYPQLLSTLVNIIKHEPHEYLKREAIKLMGILGALDPYEAQLISEKDKDQHPVAEQQEVSDVTLIMQGLTPSNDEYYPTVVINTLLNTILKDNSLVQYHSAVIDAIVTIFKTLGLKCVPFLHQIIPAFLTVIRSSSVSHLDSYFNQLSILVSIVKQHIRAFLPEMITVIREYWNKNAQVQSTILSLVESIARSLEGEFKKNLADLLPLMLSLMERDMSPARRPSERILHTFLVFGNGGEEYMHLIVPAIVRLFETTSAPISVRKNAIETLSKLSRLVNVSDYASMIIHPLAKIMGSPINDIQLRQAALDCVVALIFQLGQDFIHFIPLVSKSIKSGQISSPNYDALIQRLQKGESLPQDLGGIDEYSGYGDEPLISEADTKKLQVNQQHLKNAWTAEGKSTREDWQEWMRRFSNELLRESPSHALRACAGLATVYPPLAKDLFNSAFASCWTELFDQYQDELIKQLEHALFSQNIPPEIIQIVLNLAEFMEHDEKSLPFNLRKLGKFAGRCHAYAKALHYKEMEFDQDPPSSIEALISINNHLQQSDAAIGILRKASGFRDVEVREAWYEKLERWEEALAAYNARDKQDPGNFEIAMGRMRCLHALGEWQMLEDTARAQWRVSSQEQRKYLAALAASAAWGRGKWESMDEYLMVMKKESPDRAFFGAILALHRNQFDAAAQFIDQTREGLETELSAVIGESYNRAYGTVVRVQMLAELEEVAIYKKSALEPEKQAQLRETWNRRLLGCQRNVEVWQRMLKLRALVVSPRENLEMWIKFANLCRKSGRPGLAERSITSLSNVARDAQGNTPPEVIYAHLKYSWSAENKHVALSHLRDFTTDLEQEFRQREAQLAHMSQSNGDRINGVGSGLADLGASDAQEPRRRLSDIAKYPKLLAKCYLKQGEWQATLQRGDWRSEEVREGVAQILHSYKMATEHNEVSYKGWHAWALANFEVVMASSSSADRESATVPEPVVNDHVVPAVRGFFRSIALSQKSALQDTLRLLTLWFAHGGHDEVNRTITEGLPSVSIDTWLEVIPQLIARINQHNPKVRQAVHHLLAQVGKKHPQALVYPLTVAMKSNVTRRSLSAHHIMDSMRQHSPKLVEQADLVSHELIRVAVLWHELWHEGLEEASRLYFGDHNVEGMFATLAPLHDMLDRGAETLREVSFAQAFGHDLAEARHFCNIYKQTQEVGDLNQAWDLYYGVFRKIARQLPQLMTLDLKYVSPRLKEAHDLELAVPGSYQSGKEVTRIRRFDPILNVIPSKQRPRKMTLEGSDGKPYTYALKGHEDIRQDERVMQLFGLVNTLLSGDSECFKRHLNIQRFPAIPLSQNSGLLGWVPNSDTLHNLIKEYRESRRILLNIEHRIMLQMAPDYDNLTLMQKVEVFGYAMDNTTGKDLYRVLWLKSKSSESWLERRTNYTRSLGVMSMVGYILGLGDRHPSNLMLDRVTGNIIHIDFGDCFEIAMHREKYPERVPFRLTRMLTFAMEVSNIEGSFRITCENVMRVIRENKESLMAVLEAFIHDPLLNWRLNVRESPPRPHFKSERRASIIATDETEEASAAATAAAAAHSSTYSSRPTHRRSSVLDPLIAAQAANAVNGNSSVEDRQDAKEVQNARALQVLARVKEKLTGRDFKPSHSSSSGLPPSVMSSLRKQGHKSITVKGTAHSSNGGDPSLTERQLSLAQMTTAIPGNDEGYELPVDVQVDKLLAQATSVENLCQHYIGWCSFW
ncbi:putative phosphatidylinositol 3-kinase tor2 [Phaeomoniella chlamydospora]|uniref:non-specific serine/threonine protein kinase n=1 Tax=Phaeomoniella chlamydospora TaxID=158046 RepID=A0A0G2H5Y8_PHACM|nr:putative phosphatidylinositol 3-kinase tor2 [Phaeomoniella chlamydospora]